VLDRQPEPVRRLLLRTSILERVNGELAGLLTADEGGERMLQDLEAANAFVVSLDTSRSWFRYHQMFAGLLQLELRRAAPGEVAALHGVAAGWFAEHGYPVEGIRHAQAGRVSPSAGRWSPSRRRRPAGPECGRRSSSGRSGWAPGGTWACSCRPA
jgi:LuxR family maltose regulon positive regulatory protein